MYNLENTKPEINEIVLKAALAKIDSINEGSSAQLENKATAFLNRYQLKEYSEAFNFIYKYMPKTEMRKLYSYTSTTGTGYKVEWRSSTFEGDIVILKIVLLLRMFYNNRITFNENINKLDCVKYIENKKELEV